MAVQAQLYSDNVGLPLCGSQDWIDNGCGVFNPFCYNFQQKPQQMLQQQQLLNQQQYRNQSLCFDNSLLASTVKSTNDPTNNWDSMGYLQSVITSQVEKQKQEIDQYIKSQNERLRLLLQEQRKQQLGGVIKKIESKASLLLRQKDEEIARVTNRTIELQNMLKKLEMENQAWQRVAQENEAMVVSLNNTLEQVRERASYCFNNGAEDAESCCEVNREEIETEEERAVAGVVDGEEDRRLRNVTTMVCKCCQSRSSCVLFLPCRHLCSCKDCEAFLDSCPVCRTGKKASIEALIV